MKRINDELNQRFFPRFKVDFPFSISGKGFHFKSEMKDISCSGVYCQLRKYIAVNTILNIRLFFPLYIYGKMVKKELNCSAQIVRIYPEKEDPGINYYEVGIKFIDVVDDDKKLIMKFVRQQNLKEAKELRGMYFELKEMVAQLTAVVQGHPTAKHFHQVINKAMVELDEVTFILDREINELKKSKIL
ncbi:MAG: PilZ domain-containing protein [Candidatus Omnitrophica bacterium]|nr:PilZ domain-containing protein [Candidatus Omnitrophota bacterium]